MIAELRLCTTFDLFKALFCHANGIKIETTNSNGKGWISKAAQVYTEERFEIIPGFNFRKEIRRCQEDYQEEKKKKNLEGDLYFHPTKIEILKIQDSTSPKLVSPTETVSGAPRLYKLPNSLKSLFSPLRNNILRTMKSLEMWEIGSAGLTLIH